MTAFVITTLKQSRFVLRAREENLEYPSLVWDYQIPIDYETPEGIDSNNHRQGMVLIKAFEQLRATLSEKFPELPKKYTKRSTFALYHNDLFKEKTPQLSIESNPLWKQTDLPNHVLWSRLLNITRLNDSLTPDGYPASLFDPVSPKSIPKFKTLENNPDGLLVEYREGNIQDFGAVMPWALGVNFYYGPSGNFILNPGLHSDVLYSLMDIAFHWLSNPSFLLHRHSQFRNSKFSSIYNYYLKWFDQCFDEKTYVGRLAREHHARHHLTPFFWDHPREWPAHFEKHSTIDGTVFLHHQNN